MTAGARFHDGSRRGWRVVRVTGESMRPTLRPGDLLLVRVGVGPSVGEVVVADLPGGRGEGVKRAVRREGGGWWLERDNRTVGTDSWVFGEVADADVRGVVRLRLWPRPGRVGGDASPGADRRSS